MDFTNEKCVMLIDDSLPLGLIEFPIPILKAPPERIKAIREALYEDEFAYLTVVDFSNLAQGCKTYSEFIEKMAQTDEAALSYLGIALCGNKKKMNKLTGSLRCCGKMKKGLEAASSPFLSVFALYRFTSSFFMPRSRPSTVSGYMSTALAI